MSCWVFCGIGGIYFLLVMKLFNRINLSIGLLKATAKCSGCLKQLNKIPWILTFIGLFIGFLLLSSMTLAFSIGERKIISAQSNLIKTNRNNKIT